MQLLLCLAASNMISSCWVWQKQYVLYTYCSQEALHLHDTPSKPHRTCLLQPYTKLPYCACVWDPDRMPRLALESP